MIRTIISRIKNAQSGDTIVEVALALTVLSLILGTSSVLANRNTKSLQGTQEKSIALRYAQEQLEFLKTRVVSNPDMLTSTPKSPIKICMKNADTDPATGVCTPISNGGATYTRYITLTPVAGSANQFYDAKAHVEWESLLTQIRVNPATGVEERIGDGNVTLSYRVYSKLGARHDPNSYNCGPDDVWVIDHCAPAPRVNISASQVSIIRGNNTTLTWTASNVSVCTASGAWSGSKAVTGGTTTVSPTTTSTYTLLCTGSGGQVTASVTVTVNPPPLPRMALYSCYQFNLFQGNMLYKTNHFYTTDLNECDNRGDGTGVREGVVGYVPIDNNQNPGAIPMYGGFSSAQWDDFYTVNYGEYLTAHNNLGYNQNSRVRFWVYPYDSSSGCTTPGTIPVYRWYSGYVGNHVYIPSQGSPNNWASADGGGSFVSEGVAACIFSGP